MSQTTPHKLSYADLDRLSGEVLPGRLVLSSAGGGGGGGTDAVYACQYWHSAGTSGLLGTGLLAQPEETTLSCIPVSVHHDS
ncbi:MULTISPECIES: hypothetical protein [Actinomadura]|uniref:Uncharacterized protein n=1 Tax=Actinomadura livida TaxID=79909 RepID=A0A7W7IHH5_9ACTN|nr:MULTISPECIES: hypothetical protein [Actinomadura]MBB4777206.1 hypothetical protein [Actinomadura catellatispora]TDB96609.1 hypothetical protein E1266_09330 [Actinomadura sp. 7K534]GGU20879.1 hypothetical protein GCM10010208_52400 [Actinomadura livida]